MKRVPTDNPSVVVEVADGVNLEMNEKDKARFERFAAVVSSEQYQDGIGNIAEAMSGLALAASREVLAAFELDDDPELYTQLVHETVMSAVCRLTAAHCAAILTRSPDPAKHLSHRLEVMVKNISGNVEDMLDTSHDTRH